MSSVTGRIKEIKQPRGGYVKPSQFRTIEIMNNTMLYERIHLQKYRNLQNRYDRKEREVKK